MTEQSAQLMHHYDVTFREGMVDHNFVTKKPLNISDLIFGHVCETCLHVLSLGFERGTAIAFVLPWNNQELLLFV